MLVAALLVCAGASAVAANEPYEDLYGVIEIGSSGVKGTTYQITPDRARSIEQQFATGRQTNTHKSLKDVEKQSFKEVETNVRDERNIQRTVEEVLALKRRMTEREAVPADRILVVASSGVGALRHFDSLMRELASDGVSLVKVTAEQECSLTYRWIVPRYRYGQAVVVDIGSGNTKACYAEARDDRPFGVTSIAFELLPVGTKSFADKVLEHHRGQMERHAAAPGTKPSSAAPTVVQSAESLRLSYLNAELDRLRSSHPALENSSRLYWVGGLPFATASLMRPQRIGQDWIELWPSDFRHLRTRATQGNAYALDLAGLGPEQRKKAEETANRIRLGIFTQDQIIAGTTLALAVADKLGGGRKEASFFASIARDSWRSQLLLDWIAKRGVGEEDPAKP